MMTIFQIYFVGCKKIEWSVNESRMPRAKGENLRSVKSGNYARNQTITESDGRN